MLITKEHKPSDPQELERLKTTEGGIWVFNNKVAGMLAVSRAFGNSELKKWVIAEPYIQKLALTDEDTYLILACDGLWDVIKPQPAADLIQTELNGGAKDPTALADALLIYALEHRTTDNVTIVVVAL